jgi:hypothetical protein
MGLREEYLAAAEAAKTAGRAAGRLGATSVDQARAAAAKQEARRLEGEVRKASAAEARVPMAVQEMLERRLLATLRQEMRNLLPKPLRGLTTNFTAGEAPLAALLDARGEAYWGPASAVSGSGTWTGRVRELYGPEMQIVDVGDPSEFHGTHICYNSGFSASNDPDIYVVKTTIYGRWAWCDVPDQGYPSAPWIIWHVADEILDGNGESYSPKRYRLNDKTTGDITAPIVCGDDGGHVYVNDHNHDDVNRGMRILPNGSNHQVLTIIDGIAKFDYIRAI